MKKLRIVSMVALSLAFTGNVLAAKFEVEITNLTKSTLLTPVMVAAQERKVNLFQLGHPASEAISAVAEGGDTSALAAMFDESAQIVSTSGLLGPGETTRVTFEDLNKHSKISLASMLLPTNDGFVVAESLPISHAKAGRTFFLKAYDAGTETNDELCASIPGPQCGGEAFSPNDSGEGYVYIHSGVHGVGDLSASMYTWNNPVVKVTIKRVKED